MTWVEGMYPQCNLLHYHWKTHRATQNTDYIAVTNYACMYADCAWMSVTDNKLWRLPELLLLGPVYCVPVFVLQDLCWVESGKFGKLGAPGQYSQLLKSLCKHCCVFSCSLTADYPAAPSPDCNKMQNVLKRFDPFSFFPASQCLHGMVI